MPRIADNNPTERMLRMIEEYQDTVRYVDYLLGFFSEEQQRTLVHRPANTELVSERMRQNLTKPHTITQRLYKQRMRMIAQEYGLDPIGTRKGLVASGPQTGAPDLTTRVPQRKSIVDEDKVLGEDADYLVEQLKTGTFTFVQPTKEEVIAKSKAAFKDPDVQKSSELLQAAKSGIFSKKEDDNGLG
jgi:hypothetical protein